MENILFIRQIAVYQQVKISISDWLKQEDDEKQGKLSSQYTP